MKFQNIFLLYYLISVFYWGNMNQARVKLEGLKKLLPFAKLTMNYTSKVKPFTSYNDVTIMVKNSDGSHQGIIK